MVSGWIIQLRQRRIVKFARTLQISATLILGLVPISGHSQIYYYSGPVSGYIQVGLTPAPGYIGAFVASCTTLTETLYYDPIAQTLEEVGTVTLSPYSGSFNMVEVVGTEPTGPGGVVGSATLTVGNNGIVSFDNYQDINGGAFYSPLLIPVSGSGIYQGQAFSGSWDIAIPSIETQIIAASPTSLTFSEFNVGMGAPYGIPVLDGLMTGTDDGTYYVGWQVNSIVATAAPEANFISILGLGLLGLAFMRRRAVGVWPNC
jgi:hypothetical protein